MKLLDVMLIDRSRYNRPLGICIQRCIVFLDAKDTIELSVSNVFIQTKLELSKVISSQMKLSVSLFCSDLTIECIL